MSNQGGVILCSGSNGITVDSPPLPGLTVCSWARNIWNLRTASARVTGSRKRAVRGRSQKADRWGPSLEQVLGDKRLGHRAKEEVNQVCDCDLNNVLTSSELLLVSVSESCMF